jgi:hypothetical protein
MIFSLKHASPGAADLVGLEHSYCEAITKSGILNRCYDLSEVI